MPSPVRLHLMLLPLLLFGSACAKAHAMAPSSTGRGVVATATHATGSGGNPEPQAALPAAPSPASSPGRLTTFVLPRFAISGQIVTMGLDPATRVMEAPSNKDDVAYYRFTSPPGLGCQSPGICANTVLGAHVDWYTGDVGVFWHLKDLGAGDEVRLLAEDGRSYAYRVVSNRVFKVGSAPIDELVGPTPQESLTLITCDGSFNTQWHTYDAHRVVRAVRAE